MHRVSVIRIALALTAAAACAHGALASGEPKNGPPFTRHASQQRGVEAVSRSTTADVRGEPKDQLPFTRRVVP
jgi:hypothetical protein